MRLIEKIKNKNYWFHLAVILISLMLFQSTVSGFINKYISIGGVILEFISLFIILIVVDLVTEWILEV